MHIQGTELQAKTKIEIHPIKSVIIVPFLGQFTKLYCIALVHVKV